MDAIAAGGGSRLTDAATAESTRVTVAVTATAATKVGPVDVDQRAIECHDRSQ
jgi:hypothetical protein